MWPRPIQHSRHQVLSTACPLAMCCSRSVAVVCRCHKFFRRLALLDICWNYWATAARAPTFFHKPHTFPLLQSHHLQELFTFGVRQLDVTLELDSQVPSTTCLDERDASVRSFTHLHNLQGKTVSQPQRLRSCADKSALPMFIILNRTSRFTTSPRTFCSLQHLDPVQ